MIGAASAAGQPSVLVVEDESLLLFTTADDLRDAGYAAFEATNAAAALKLAETLGGVDVLFTDVDMPGTMDGLGLARAVQARWPETRIVITSGHIMLTAGDLPPGAGFVPKPYRIETVVEAIRGG